jgi:hypothetical protein
MMGRLKSEQGERKYGERPICKTTWPKAAVVKFLQAFIRQEGPVREYSFPRVKRTWLKGGE